MAKGDVIKKTSNAELLSYIINQNPVLKENLDFYYPDKYKRFIFGCLKNKDYKSMISELFDGRDEIYFYHFDYPNSATVEELQAKCPYKSEEYTTKFDYSDGKLTVICGSFYMIKELLNKL